MAFIKKIGDFTPAGDVTKTAIKVEVNKEGMVFIIQDENIIVFHKEYVPNLLDLLERIK